ncbi:class I SAM-dependent methyltransferase [Nocardioides sp. cx-173]|uniref:N5-glutamine methyltransferase family protein n=1 Tax=Nocardioides sp. cx-173 TaxID=2898796 RepID=UPI001E462B41|nr:class I SAM-dependent methyltransferase [Nocardioides sp. cx-173]MCD4523386.1 class I SAM-dependent methyltransferase [Nocardioides sp. cx-173]UGB42275.1 class I SAM-dependent methyltransferase [Nocardioides sp. cx-173]
MPEPLDFTGPLRDSLEQAGFTYDGVRELLGSEAHDALMRNETTPGRRRTAGASAVETLVRLFLLQVPVAREAAERALPGQVDRLAAEGLLEQSVGEVAARLDIRPYAADDTDLWVLSDLTPGLDGGPQRVGADHVLGISGASSSLAQLTLREPVGRALDLGTGCGVQALHLAAHSDRVVATDVNARALRLTRLNAALNGVADRVEVRDGSYFEPVAGERFDLIATNPPFVISPGTGERLVYRDSGLPGDRVVEDIVRAAPAHLTEGGWCQVLANWVISRERPWDERLGGWLAGDCDALVVQREVVDPATYVELWLKDAGLHGTPGYLERYDTWLSWFDEQGVEAIGFGWVNLRASGGGPGESQVVSELLDWPYEVEQPIAPAIRAWGAAAHARVDADSRLVTREDVRQETVGPAGAEDPEVIVLRQQRGLRRARQVDTVEAALVGACDGELTLGQILDAVAQLTDADAGQVRATYLPVAGELVREGFLELA